MWHNDHSIGQEELRAAAAKMSAAVELGLPALFTQTGLLVVPGRTKSEWIRLVHLANRTATHEAPTAMVVHPLSESGDVIAILFSEPVATRLSNSAGSDLHIEQLDGASRLLIKPLLAAHNFELCGESNFVFDMEAVALQSVAAIAGSRCHQAMMLTTALSGLEAGEKIDVIMLLSKETLCGTNQVRLKEAA